MSTPQLKPTVHRFAALDALRGFAVLGNFTTILVEGSMRGLFSLIFGAGVYLFTVRAIYPDGPIRIADLYYRRTLWLVVFGVAHAYFLIMPGSILLTYGLAGLILFPFRVLPARRLVLLAMALLIGVAAYTLPIELAESRLEQAAARPEVSKLQNMIESNTGSLREVEAMIMMLLGLAFCKWGVVTGERRLSIYLRLMIVGYAIGIAFRGWVVLNVWESFDQVGRLAMTLGHLGLFFTIWKFCSGSLPMRALAATGRMALSHYIGQTVIAHLIFSGVGFSLYGTLPRSQVYGIMLAIWLLQLTFSLLWLKRFRFGPLEWAWRCLTYGRLTISHRALQDLKH